ncbi:Hypothetical predicted protein [Mytilus galloprovincialis]|uniref:Uncharacterized protein n=1 Tax=Mytilus galloprovincialis TaxID=29158 RepID=A0A8B6G575_MYTGA|nr:Hypothetical predicted protein [Mytilus galloprovincialis]
MSFNYVDMGSGFGKKSERRAMDSEASGSGKKSDRRAMDSEDVEVIVAAMNMNEDISDSQYEYDEQFIPTVETDSQECTNIEGINIHTAEKI